MGKHMVGTVPFPEMNCEIQKRKQVSSPLFVYIVQGNHIVCGKLNSLTYYERVEGTESLDDGEF